MRIVDYKNYKDDVHTQRSSLPGKSIDDPPGSIDPITVHGPSTEEEDA
jgi:hypothetical protein